jgi:basic membrane protein A
MGFSMTPSRSIRWLPLVALVVLSGCKKEEGNKSNPAPAGSTAAAKPMKIGLVTDVGGRGDQSFNDSGLRGLELWAAGKRFTTSGYVEAPKADYEQSVPKDLAAKELKPLSVQPVVLQSKVQEDYEPNLQLLVDQGAGLSVGVGFMLENAVEAVAKRNPNARFLLIDSPLLDEKGTPYTLPNVRTVVFREEQGSFLVGALAGLVTKTNKVGFVGGMEVPLIKRFEAGFRAGVMTTNPKAEIVVNYTGSFDNVAAGKQVGQDLAAKGADVIFQAAGADGVGVIQAVKESRAQGTNVYVIGVDSDQHHVAPEAVLTSMLKRVDLAIYEGVRDAVGGKFTSGDVVMGLKEGGVTYADVRVDFPGKAEVLQKVEALRQRVIAGEIKVPASASELASFKAAP